MTLHDLAMWILYSAWSNAILWVLVLLTLYMEFRYWRAHTQYNTAIDASYIDPDDTSPERTLELMQQEFARMRVLTRKWVKRFYWALAGVLVYALLITTASHYLR